MYWHLQQILGKRIVAYFPTWKEDAPGNDLNIVRTSPGSRKLDHRLMVHTSPESESQSEEYARAII